MIAESLSLYIGYRKDHKRYKKCTLFINAIPINEERLNHQSIYNERREKKKRPRENRINKTEFDRNESTNMHRRVYPL